MRYATDHRGRIRESNSELPNGDEEFSMSETKRNDDQPKPMTRIPRILPIVTIKGRKYYVDERLREYRAVDNPHVRISFED
jgi:hypothetical protein